MRDHRATAATVRSNGIGGQRIASEPALAASAPRERGARSAAIREWMGNPLIVAVVGTLLASLVIPQLTQRWQDHQQGLEVQTSLVSSMSSSASDAVISARLLAGGLYTGAEWQRRYNEALRSWSVASPVIKAKLEGYFPDSTLGDDWRTYGFGVTGYLQIAAPVTGRDARIEDLRRLVGPSGIDWAVLEHRDDARFQSEYVQLGFLLLDRLDVLVERVLAGSPNGV
jgi:hypothetical protein